MIDENSHVKELSNADLIAAILQRLAKTAPSREKSLVVTKLHEALLWLGTPVSNLP